MIYALIVAIVAFIAGWLIAPVALVYNSGECMAESLFIYDEPRQNIITQGRWYTHDRSGEHYYQAKMIINEDGKPSESVISHRTINTSFIMHRDSVSLHTDKTFRIAGPKVSDPKWGRYIDPMAEENYSSRIYLFHTEGGRVMAGYRNIPITTCLSEK